MVSVEGLAEQGADFALVCELPPGAGVLGSLEHPEHLARDEVLQQCHCRPLFQAAAVTRRLDVPEERHQPKRGMTRELPRGVRQGLDVRVDASNGVASWKVQAAPLLCEPVQVRRQKPLEAGLDHCVILLLASEGA